MKRNTALIDFAGPGRKVFQCTVSVDHDIKPRALEDLLLVAGYIEKDENGNFVAVTSNLPPPLDFYWVVPFGRFQDWKKRAPKTLNVTDVVKNAFGSHVNQYVLSMDIVSPSAQHIHDLVQDQHPLKVMLVAVEGSFGDLSTKAVEKMAKELGAKRTHKNVIKSTTHVIKGSGAREKQIKKAEAAFVKIVEMEEFLDMYQNQFNSIFSDTNAIHRWRHEEGR
jgi:NAD-dependent DNA ligase